MSITSSFAAEAFLEDPIPPDVNAERSSLVIRLSLMIVALVAVAPVVLGKLRYPSSKESDKEAPVSVKWLPRFNILGIVLAGYWIMKTPNNLYSARSVFIAPLLSEDECKYLIQASHEAAHRNLEQNPDNAEFQKYPQGWRKERHGSYPTVDLNLVTDPFTKEDRHYLGDRLHKRLVPVISRIYGVVPSSIRAIDMFVVRYDADEGQQQLKPHTDEAHISFNILLNDEFEGGGTRFHNRRNGEYYDVFPDMGSVLLNNAVIRHEGLPTTQGTRYIMVGFLSIDKRHAFTGMDTGLSIFASWLSMPWTHARFKQGAAAVASRQRHGETKSTLLDGLFHLWYTGMATLLEYVGDAWAPHESHTLVHVDNLTDYLAALDAAPLTGGRAIWFQGQRRVKRDGKVVDRESNHDPREL